jgi:hypothetical protein
MNVALEVTKIKNKKIKVYTIRKKVWKYKCAITKFNILLL